MKGEIGPNEPENPEEGDIWIQVPALKRNKMDQYVYEELMTLLESMRRLEGDNDDLSMALDDVETAIKAEWRESRRGLRAGPVVVDECLTDLLEREHEDTTAK